MTPDGTGRQVADGLAWGNGMAVTPDNKTLIVAESHANQLTAFDIADDGGLSNRRVWADLGADNPDGICLDADGAVWYADVPHQHCVRVREGGEVLQRVPVDRGCFACMLGGPDGRTLFVVAAGGGSAWTACTKHWTRVRACSSPRPRPLSRRRLPRSRLTATEGRRRGRRAYDGGR
ncbi:SMP-30/gluconolactonase/LRE family protein [Fodinicola feengrottensis]|uniref:SMP-30/gluconolactonase/LRE family protein n=1 Tax=Fodinicola feengrottensis TaxID=435914 RepID=UPI0024426F0F|nr:SMP-30/gluconolactonase/LRE family protein [Fodinicola feengrottensis]